LVRAPLYFEHGFNGLNMKARLKVKLGLLPTLNRFTLKPFHSVFTSLFQLDTTHILLCVNLLVSWGLGLSLKERRKVFMKKNSKALKWLASNFKPKQAFVLGDSWFGIIPQGLDQFSIKHVKLSECEFVADEGEWLSWPELVYETASGAHYAILLNFQQQSVGDE
jgi:hypothetical protein